MLVGARGMGVGDERKLHHGGQAQAEDEEQHNDAASLPAGMSLATGERALVFASVPGTRRANLLLVNITMTTVGLGTRFHILCGA